MSCALSKTFYRHDKDVQDWIKDLEGSAVREINFSKCHNITDAAMTALANHCANLTTINLDCCTNITDAAITALAANCANLTTINLNFCYKITDAAITALAANCANLTTINLNFCSNITDAAITALAANCANLTDINLDCCMVTDESVKALAAKCPNLATIWLGHHLHERPEWAPPGPRITPIGKFALKQCMPHIKVGCIDTYSDKEVKTDPQLLEQLTHWYCKTGLTPVGNFLVEAYRPRFAELRIKRFWRDVCYKPDYRYARERLMKEFDREDSEGE